MRSVFLVVFLGWSLLLSSCAGMRGGTPSLPVLMVQRLDWMDEVAESKRAKRLPITDPKREAGLLRTMTERGVAAGLPAEKVRLFFTGQMQAAKLRQEEWLRQHPTASGEKVPDLVGTIRPALDELGRQMIVQLVRQRQSKNPVHVRLIEKDAREQLARAGYSETVIHAALEGLRGALRK